MNDNQGGTAVSVRIIAMSDLHLGKKPWQVRKALQLGQNADIVLLAGDLVNDGTPEQMERMHRCIEDKLPGVPVLAVAGNHDYPRQPSPMLREGICDYPAMQAWLLSRQHYPYTQDSSGAYALRAGELDIIGLNCVSHWRRFKFPNGLQLKWLASYLKESDAMWHIVMCHAPLLAHNPKRSERKPYLSRDDQLQTIIDAHRNIIFLSGHTHICMGSAKECVEWDEARHNIYINDGSIRPTTVLREDGTPAAEPGSGNIAELKISSDQVTITAISVTNSAAIPKGEYCFLK